MPMKNLFIQNQIDELSKFSNVLNAPFPYPGCKELLNMEGEKIENLIPDLDLYFSNIAGYYSSIKRVSKWPHEKIAEASKHLDQTFFEKHPEYRYLEFINHSKEIQNLFNYISIYERIRITLQSIFTHLLLNSK